MKKIIIDANVAHEFPSRTKEATDVIEWVRSKGFVAMGGLNLVELQRTRIGPLLAALKSAGRALQFDGEAVDALAVSLQAPSIRSDDPHILALAVVSHARLLFSRDQALQHDFTNPEILKDPRGKCYTSASKHKRLLSRA